MKLALLEDGLSGSAYRGSVGAVCSSRLCGEADGEASRAAQARGRRRRRGAAPRRPAAHLQVAQHAGRLHGGSMGPATARSRPLLPARRHGRSWRRGCRAA